MLSTANSRPPRKSKIPKTRYHHTNEALRSGTKLPSRCDPQISAARRGEAAAKAPSAMATVLTNRIISTGIRMIDAVSELPLHLVLGNIGAVPPSAPKSLKKSSGIRIAIGLRLNEIDHSLL